MLGKKVSFTVIAAEDGKSKKVNGTVMTIYEDGRKNDLEIDLDQGGTIFLSNKDVEFI